MTRRHLFWVSLLALAAILAAGIGAAVYVWQDKNELQGKLVFAKTFDAGITVDEIMITSAEDQVKLEQKDSYWYVANKGNYYADFRLIHQFLSAINQSTYSVKLPYNKENMKMGYLFFPEKDMAESGLLIQTYAKGEKLDEMIVGLPDENERYFFAKRPNVDEIWLIDGNFNLPLYAKDWLLRPVLSIPDRGIESITMGDRYIQKEHKNGSFVNEAGLEFEAKVLTDILRATYMTDARRGEQFRAEYSDESPQKIIDVITFYGLEVILRLYYAETGNVWMNVKLSTTPLPISEVKDYIEDNRFLYDDWYFEIVPEQSYILRGFRL